MTWLGRLLRRGGMETHLDKELRFHIQEHAADLEQRGYGPAEARRIALIELGGAEQVKERCRDARGTRWIDDLRQDIRHTFRAFRRNPGFTVVALLTLGLGSGATTVMFTVIDGVLLKPLPYPEPDRLLVLREQTDWSTHFGNLWSFSYPNFLDARRQSRSLDMAAWRFGGATAKIGGAAEYVDSLEVSSNLFSMLGAPLASGRAFLPEEDRLGAAPVAIVTEAFARRHFGENAIGRTLVFDEKNYVIVGVARSGFWPVDGSVDLYTPIGQNSAARLLDRGVHSAQVWARLRPGVTIGQARTDLALAGHSLAERFPKTNRGRTFIAGPMRRNAGDASSTLWLLLGAVSLVLAIACVNVASLLLARTISREREWAMRAALGARRGRLVRQCLTESLVLAGAGGALGFVFATLGSRPFAAIWPGSLPGADGIGIDWRVMAFAAGASVVSGVLFGLAPALRTPIGDLEQTLRSGARSVTGRLRGMHAVFVIAEIALATVLLACAGMLSRTLLRLEALNPGLDIHNVITARVALPSSTLANVERTRAAWLGILDRGRAVPGVEAISLVDTVPMRQGNNQVAFWTSPATPEAQRPVALATCVTPEYLKTMGLELREGRFFNEQDRPNTAPVAVVDDMLARQTFGEAAAAGRRIWIDGFTDPLEIVGVVRHVRHWGLAQDDGNQIHAQIYYPFAQLPDRYVRRWSELMSIAVRTRDAPGTVVDTLRQVIGSGGDRAVYEVQTMEQLAAASVARQRFLLVLFGAFSGVALALACVGIYGVMAYLTNRRIPEIGLRMAMGARASDVIGMVLREGLAMILAGVILGAGGAIGAGQLLRHHVDGVQSYAPGTFAILAAALIAAALIASFLPARRASRIDPMKALRTE
ncbi:MAG: ABC transporter permease [Acidobacteriota bacterium]|nr:ABC transporter permease [Acidobacteriota bacterium]